MASSNMLNRMSSGGHTICQDCLECIDCGLCKCGHSRRIDMNHLAHALRTMGPKSKLMITVRAEMKRRNRWKDLRGYHDPKKQTKKDNSTII